MKETVYRSDCTGEIIDSEEYISIDVVVPMNSKGSDYEVGSIDINKYRIPKELIGKSYSESRDTLLVFCEGAVGMGGSTPYPRIIGIGIAGDKDTDHNKTLSRKSAIEMYEEQFVEDIEEAIRNRYVVKQKQDMYTD